MGQWLGGTMASAEHERIMGVWGQSPSGVQGQSPWSGPPPEAESILVIGCPTEPANLAPFQKMFFRTSLHATKSYRKQYALLRSTGVRVGGPRVHGAPNPVIGGPVPPGSAAYGDHTCSRSR